MDDEELLHEVRMVQEECVSPTQTEVDDIPVARGQPLQICDRTSAERNRFTDTKSRTRAGRPLRRVHARAPFHPLPRINRRHIHSHNERSFSAELSCGAITTS